MKEKYKVLKSNRQENVNTSLAKLNNKLHQIQNVESKPNNEKMQFKLPQLGQNQRYDINNRDKSNERNYNEYKEYMID